MAHCGGGQKYPKIWPRDIELSNLQDQFFINLKVHPNINYKSGHMKGKKSPLILNSRYKRKNLKNASKSKFEPKFSIKQWMNELWTLYYETFWKCQRNGKG